MKNRYIFVTCVVILIIDHTLTNGRWEGAGVGKTGLKLQSITHLQTKAPYEADMYLEFSYLNV